MPNLRQSVSRKTNTVVQSLEGEVSLYDLRFKQAFDEKPRKRIRICLRCQANLTVRNKCDQCGLKFHDGLLVSWIKKLLGISPR